MNIWWFDTRSTNRGELIALASATLYAVSAFLPQARLCVEEDAHRHARCQGEIETVWLEPSVVLFAFLATGIVLAAVYLSQHPTRFSDSLDPRTSTILLATSFVSLAVASIGVPRGDVIAYLIGTWVQVTAFALMFVYGASLAFLRVFSR
ncbi:hypothetical protein [Natronosalvus vescus]|uniref:hypothetical protein n=1 Tax=Natronosalvus vescus TaxID=2953881 RepID=UPI0020904265|nr:hypothetical protein [Natronosalvus vescus]